MKGLWRADAQECQPCSKCMIRQKWACLIGIMKSLKNQTHTHPPPPPPTHTHTNISDQFYGWEKRTHTLNMNLYTFFTIFLKLTKYLNSEQIIGYYLIYGTSWCLSIKDKRGAPDCQESLDWTAQSPQKIRSWGCIPLDVQDPGNELSQEQCCFLLVQGIFFFTVQD